MLSNQQPQRVAGEGYCRGHGPCTCWWPEAPGGKSKPLDHSRGKQGRLEPTTLSSTLNSLLAADPEKGVLSSRVPTCLTGTRRSRGSLRSLRPRRCSNNVEAEERRQHAAAHAPAAGSRSRAPCKSRVNLPRPTAAQNHARKDSGGYPPT